MNLPAPQARSVTPPTYLEVHPEEACRMHIDVYSGIIRTLCRGIGVILLGRHNSVNGVEVNTMSTYTYM